MVMVGVPMLTTELDTVDEEAALARLTPANAAPTPAAARAATTSHFLWLPDAIFVVVGVTSPDLAGAMLRGAVGVISAEEAAGGAAAGRAASA